jgi:hypothetical protein
MMRMEDGVKLWNSERASGEVVEVSWWELTTLFCVVIESSMRNREGEDFRPRIEPRHQANQLTDRRPGAVSETYFCQALRRVRM